LKKQVRPCSRHSTNRHSRRAERASCPSQAQETARHEWDELVTRVPAELEIQVCAPGAFLRARAPGSAQSLLTHTIEHLELYLQTSDCRLLWLRCTLLNVGSGSPLYLSEVGAREETRSLYLASALQGQRAWVQVADQHLGEGPGYFRREWCDEVSAKGGRKRSEMEACFGDLLAWALAGRGGSKTWVWHWMQPHSVVSQRGGAWMCHPGGLEDPEGKRVWLLETVLVPGSAPPPGEHPVAVAGDRDADRRLGAVMWVKEQIGLRVKGEEDVHAIRARVMRHEQRWVGDGQWGRTGEQGE
jgi:hypothetical protein